MTLPLSIVSLASEAIVNVKSCPSCCCASACVSSTMFGIGFCPRETFSRTVSPRCRTAPGRRDRCRRRCWRPLRRVAHELRRLDVEAELVAAEDGLRLLSRSCPSRSSSLCEATGGGSVLVVVVAGRRRRVVPRDPADRKRRQRADGEQQEQARAARASASACAASGGAAACRRSAGASARAAARCGWPRPPARTRSDRAATIAECTAVAATGTRPRRTRSRSAANSSALP